MRKEAKINCPYKARIFFSVSPDTYHIGGVGRVPKWWPLSSSKFQVKKPKTRAIR